MQWPDDLSRKNYPPVGRCIYCGSTDDLRREHIIPRGLSGSTTLLKASCGSCADITSRVETTVIRGPWYAVRIVQRLHITELSRVPKTFSLTLIKDGREQVIHLPINEYPVVLMMPLYPLPEVMSGAPHQSGIHLVGYSILAYGPRPGEVTKRFGADGGRITQKHQFVDIARMLAKIALAFAVAELGIDRFEAVYVRDLILGKIENLGRFVGTRDRHPPTMANHLHQLSLEYDPDSRLLAVNVRLMASEPTPAYVVIVGRLKAAEVPDWLRTTDLTG
jgi:hypothetical protein